MQIKIVSSLKALPKQFEQIKTCSNLYHASSLPDTFINSNSHAIAFKGNMASSFTSRLLKLFRKNPFKAATSELPKLEELTSASVAEKLNAQLAYFRLSDIGKIISSCSFKDRKLAKLSLAHMSQWGRFESLNTLTSNLAKENKTLYSENRTCLANSIGYLKGKGSFNNLTFANIDNYTEIKGKGMILLDEFVLERLSQDRKLVEFLKQNPDIQLCYPDGWIHGINPFNQTSTEEVSNIVQRVTQQARTLINKNGMSADDAIGHSLNTPVISQLEKLGLKDRLKIIGGDKIDKKKASLDDIAKQFKPQMLTAEYLEKTLNSELSEKYRQLMLEAINSEAQIVDPRRLGLMMQDQYKKILEYAKQRNISPENITYFVYKPEKSYSIIAQQYQSVNKIPINKFVDNIKDLSRKDLVVVLDDYAGSGASMSEAAQIALNSKSNNFLLSPMFSTESANEKLAELKNFVNDYGEDNPNVMVMPYKTIKNFKYSNFYTEKSESEKKLLDKIFPGKFGLSADSTVTLPYMAPDNNNAFFNEFVASQSLLNGKGAKIGDFHWADIKKQL